MKTLQFKTILSALFLTVSVVTFSCKEDKQADPEPLNAATITITSPAEHAAINASDSVNITGTITATQNLHGYTLYIRRQSDNLELFKKEVHGHATNITIAEKCLLDKTLASSQTLELEVVASLDHDGNTASKKQAFHCMQ